MRSRRGLQQHYNHRPDCQKRMRAMRRAFFQQQQHLSPSDNPTNDTQDAQMTDTERSSDPIEQQHYGVSMEEVEDDGDEGQGMGDDLSLVDEYPHAGMAYDEDPAPYQTESRKQEAGGQDPWAPFASLDEWKLAEWMMKKGISQKSMNELVNLSFVSLVQI